MGLLSWFRGWQTERRRKKETAALEELKNILGEEQAEFTLLRNDVETIESLLMAGKFMDAEKLVPGLVVKMKRKKLFDNIELTDFNKFRRTIFKDVQAQMRQLK